MYLLCFEQFKKSYKLFRVPENQYSTPKLIKIRRFKTMSNLNS